MHSPEKLGTARLSRWAWGGTPTITKTSGPCQSILSSVLQPAVLLARIFWFFAFLFHQAGGDLFSVLPQGTAQILAGLRFWQSRGNAQGSGRFPAELNSTWPCRHQHCRGQRSRHSSNPWGQCTYTWEEDSFIWSLHSKIKKIPDSNLFPFIYK